MPIILPLLADRGRTDGLVELSTNKKRVPLAQSTPDSAIGVHSLAGISREQFQPMR
jgi:hypothetical protein